ncbi:MAG TPA: Rossmann-like and DUF2520 domain-containing protein [Gemmatimonadales bacterium]|nr:Rossmann-like and DUF2520 domain-containing protein [Gemmatimonadales bacterium]
MGAGRMGAGIGVALEQAGRDVTLLARTQRAAVGPLAVIAPEAAWAEPLARADTLIIATPDDAIASVAERLSGFRLQGHSVVLHLSGLLDHHSLDALSDASAGLGSLHPLMAVPDPLRGPELLRGAWAAVEGSGPAAIERAGELARAVGMEPVQLPPGAKPAYHAAATIASNYTVTLYDMAVRTAIAAGIAPDAASVMYLPLVKGTVANLGNVAPAAALTGAIRRGDAESVRSHLAALGDGLEAECYRVLGLATLELAVRAGLAPEAAERVRRELRVES